MASINGNSYDFGSIKVSFLGNVDVEGFNSINYEETQEKTNLFGRGHKVVGRTRGAKTVSGSIGLLPEELEKMQDAAGKTSLIDIPPFDMVVSFNNGTSVIKVHKLKGVEFTKNMRGFSQSENDTFQEIDFIASEIQYS